MNLHAKMLRVRGVDSSGQPFLDSPKFSRVRALREMGAPVYIRFKDLAAPKGTNIRYWTRFLPPPPGWVRSEPDKWEVENGT